MDDSSTAARGFAGIECSLYGLINEVELLMERLLEMGGKMKRFEEQQTVYSPRSGESQRTSALLQLIGTGDAEQRIVSYRSGDYTTGEKTNTINVGEVLLLEGDVQRLFEVIEYTPVRKRSYEAIKFDAPAGFARVMVRVTRDEESGGWLVKAMGRCTGKSTMGDIENELLQLASFLDE